MALLEKHLVVKKSQLPDAGKGLFTTVAIPGATRIVEYKGRISTWKEVEDFDGKNGYIFYVNRKRVIDALPYKKALGRFANDARGIARVKGLRNNADYIVDGDRCFIESRRRIKAGEEIFVDYGSDYWKVIRHNRDLEVKPSRPRKKTRRKTAKTAR